MLDQRRRRWADIVQMLYKCFVFAGKLYSAYVTQKDEQAISNEMKWNESGFRPPLCTYRLNWARRTSWGWWDDWDDTVLQTQDSKSKPWRPEAEHATSRSRRLPTILTFTRGWNIFCFFQTAETGNPPMRSQESTDTLSSCNQQQQQQQQQRQRQRCSCNHQPT